MKTNQAKKIARINYKVLTRDDYARAERDCVKQIVGARRAGNDTRAAELSAAKAVFQKRARPVNLCADCGVTIARGATHCRIHARGQGKSLAGGKPPTLVKKTAPNNNARVHVSPSGGQLAEIGFYAPEIQSVVRKWLPEVGREKLEGYFISVACAVIRSQKGDSELTEQVDFENRHHWAAIFELGTAFAKIMSQKGKPTFWLLTLPSVTVGSVNSGFRTWENISEEIFRESRLEIKAGALKKAYNRLRMTTPKQAASEWRTTTSKLL